MTRKNQKQIAVGVAGIGIAVVLLCLIGVLLVNDSGASRQKQTPRKTVDINVQFEEREESKKAQNASRENGKVQAAEKSAEPGALPPLKASYRKSVGFSAYAARMQQLGAAFYLYGNGGGGFYRIDADRKQLKQVAPKTLKQHNYSPRSRVIRDEPALTWAREQAKKRYGVQSPKLILLVPGEVEQQIAQRLKKHFQTKQHQFEQVVALKGHYRKRASGLRLILTQARLADGQSHSMKVEVSL